MFEIIRILLSGAFVGIFLLIFKSVIKNKKLLIILCVVVAAIVLCISLAVPIENYVYTFDSPEEVAAYLGKGELDVIVEGENSVYALIEKNKTLTEIIAFPKTSDGYKLGSQIKSNILNIHSIVINDAVLSIYNYKDTNDYYIDVYCNNELKVYDNRNTEFYHYGDNLSSCIGYVNDLNGYVISINGSEYSF